MFMDVLLRDLFTDLDPEHQSIPGQFDSPLLQLHPVGTADIQPYEAYHYHASEGTQGPLVHHGLTLALRISFKYLMAVGLLRAVHPSKEMPPQTTAKPFMLYVAGSRMFS